MTTRSVKAPRLTRVSPQGHLVIAALRALPQAVRQIVFQELATDVLLRTELEAALTLTGKELLKSPVSDSRLLNFKIVHPLKSARALAESSAEKLAAVSYPYVIHASAKLVAFSGWMAHNYVKHAHSGAVPALPASTHARRSHG